MKAHAARLSDWEKDGLKPVWSVRYDVFEVSKSKLPKELVEKLPMVPYNEHGDTVRARVGAVNREFRLRSLDRFWKDARAGAGNPAKYFSEQAVPKSVQ